MPIASKNAFLTAYDKTYVPAFAEALHAADYTIVSLGSTADLIEEQGVPVVQTVEFLGKTGLQVAEELPDRTRREIVAASLSQTLALRPEELEAMGWPVIDLAYINLMPPVAVPSLEATPAKTAESRQRTGIKIDKGGIGMIHAAIEGERPIMIEPWQIAQYAAGRVEIEALADDRTDTYYASKYIEAYGEQVTVQVLRSMVE